MANAIPTGITPAHVLRALSDIDAGDRGRFGQSTYYDLIYDGRRYPPKAVLGLAAKHLTGQALGPEDFSGGERSKCFSILRRLGFTIELKPHWQDAAQRGWSRADMQAVVDDYFRTLQAELAGQEVDQTSHNRRLRSALQGRSNEAIELKRRQITAVLQDLSFPAVDGYDPAAEYEESLGGVVDEFLSTNPVGLDIQDTTERVPEVNRMGRGDFAAFVVETPFSSVVARERKPRLGRPKKYDFRVRDAENRELGRKGEKLVLQFEQWRLAEANRPDLVREITWVADSKGDGAGYDIESRDVYGTPIYIEVKTTNCRKEFPFLLSANELNASKILGKAFWLYRIFEFNRQPRMYRVNGDLSQALELSPAVFESRGLKRG